VQQGRPIPQIDVQIAAIARVNDLTLLTSDKHFRTVDNLKLEDWLSPAP
jgi:tRNA(fMet)-specific endonuclease VapC